MTVPSEPAARAPLRPLFAARARWVSALEGLLASVPLVLVAIGAARSLRDPQRAHWSFDERLPRVRVFFDRSRGERVDCWDHEGRGAFVCRGVDWVVVRRAEPGIGGHPEPCIHAHPSPDGVLHVRYPRVTLGPVLHLETALADSASPGSSVHVRVTAETDQGSTVLAAFTHTTRPGFEGHDLDLRDRAGTTAAVDLAFRVDAPGAHHFCFRGGP